MKGTHMGARVGVWLMQRLAVLPLPLLRALGWLLGQVLYVLAVPRRRIALRNFQLCFPEASAAQHRAWVRETFVYFCQAFLDRSWLWSAPEEVVRARVMRELPFMATENIMMDAVKRGGDRQALHERLREHSQEAARVVKEEGGANDLIDRIAADPLFGVTRAQIEAILEPANFIGRSAEQVTEFLSQLVDPLLEANAGELGVKAVLSV